MIPHSTTADQRLRFNAFQTIPDLLRFADKSQLWLSFVASQSLEQIIPRATQSPAETRQYRDGREFRPALDFLEISPAHVGFLGERLLC